jgi:selenocysteine-specific elongation factor
MPQTREHLAICNLLHIKSGLVALTKRDLVEEEWLELVKDDVSRLLRGTFLEGCAILPVSSKTGEGLVELRAALQTLAEKVPPKAADQSPRLPIDRVFTVKGFGTVVTGTLTAGRLALDDRVEIYPKGAQAKVRGLQCHGHPVEQAIAGQRTAVNLQGVERAAVERGDVLGLPGALVPSFLVDATLELLKDAPRPLKARDRVRFHAGTSEVMARVLLVDRPILEPGDTTHGRFRLEGPIVALPGDRYVIRSYSPIITIGGGTLLDVTPPRFKRKAPTLLAHLQILERGTPEEVLEEHLRQAGPLGLKTGDLRARTPFAPARLKELLESLATSGKIVAVDREWFVHGEARQRLREQVLRVLEVFHRQNPLRSGMSREELRTRAGGAEERLFSHMLGALETEGLVKAEKDRVRLATHQIRLSPSQRQAVDKIEAFYRSAGAAPPGPEEALAKAGLGGSEENELFQLLLEERRLVRIKESLFFHAEILKSIEDKLVAFLREKKEMTPADMKDLFGVSRKYAIPLMEYFDGQRVTQRVGDKRVLRGTTEEGFRV